MVVNDLSSVFPKYRKFVDLGVFCDSDQPWFPHGFTATETPLRISEEPSVADKHATEENINILQKSTVKLYYGAVLGHYYAFSLSRTCQNINYKVLSEGTEKGHFSNEGCNFFKIELFIIRNN